ncbi:hypothetical protein PITCH_A420039 [uncultured Desulfobacterium sp.]|uniref:Uncharacterized protein n=1 Tax=uncultured Desulfobacterium sp. TaxID=201089 RepID=A0A445N001_9BACT|nr:hypothetical protein PITCH_A420039 [uncultured Desulfobacterium sp.]
MENNMEVALNVEGKYPFSELMNRVTNELEGRYNKDKDAIKLKEFSKDGNQIHLVYEVIKGGAIRPKKEFSSPYKELGGRKPIFG